MSWGNNLTLIGAVRRMGWVTLGTQWRAMTSAAFLTLDPSLARAAAAAAAA